MSSDEVAIRIDGARKSYRRGLFLKPRTVVDGVSISVMRGSIHGLLGPNGAGKTTTIKMLLGLVRPDGGTFQVLGEDATRPYGRRELGFLPEQPYFPTHLTALHALRFYGQLAGVAREARDKRAFELLEIVGLTGFEHTELAKFSRGMLQRLGIAQAIVAQPAVVVLDEPASGLDPVGQRDMRNLMTGLREQGTTVLLSSHQLSEVEAICDRVSILNAGVVAAEGHIDDLLNVDGQTSVRVRGLSILPATVAAMATDVALSGGHHVFSIPDAEVRRVVDLLDDAGGAIESVAPKRSSLEDYFARLIDDTRKGAA